jgi:pyridoxamine 5'-phosphate oxidase
MALFESWLADAEQHELNDPTAMSLATVDGDGFPNVRMVLLKSSGPDGFVFYTNIESAKGQELKNNPKAALCFHWKSLRRQVRIRGLIEPVTEEQADEYFSTRSRGSQIGAWASKQSRPLESRFALEKAVAVYGARFAVGTVPRPDYWSGYSLLPLEIEFWHDRPFRLHERLVFRRKGLNDVWITTKLFP